MVKRAYILFVSPHVPNKMQYSSELLVNFAPHWVNFHPRRGRGSLYNKVISGTKADTAQTHGHLIVSRYLTSQSMADIVVLICSVR